MTRDSIEPLGDAIKNLMDDRPASCSYYHSWEYTNNRQKSIELDRKIHKVLGEKTWKKIFKYLSELSNLNGELQAGIQESCYRLGFNDALQLVNQLNEAGKGHLNIFTTSGVT